MKRTAVFIAAFISLSFVPVFASTSTTEAYLKACHLIKAGYVQDAAGILKDLSANKGYILNDYAQYKLASLYDNDAEYIKLAEEHPESALAGKASFKAAEISFYSGNYQKAAYYYDQAVKLGRSNTPKDTARYKSGLSYENLGLYQEAVDRYSQVNLYHPFSPHLKNAMSRLNAIGIRPKSPSPEALFERAQMLFEKKDYMRSAAEYKKMLDLYPSSSLAPQALLKLALCYYKSGMSKSAVQLFEAGKYYSPQSFYYKGFAHLKQGNFPDAVASFNKLSEMFPGSELASDAEYWIADYYSKNGYEDFAETAFSNIIKKYQGSSTIADACWKLGFSYYSKGRFDLAYSTFGEAFEKVPAAVSTSKCLYWQAKSAQKMGMSDVASRIYHNVAVKYPNTYYGYRAMELLNMKMPPLSTVNLPLMNFEAGPSENIQYKKFCELFNNRFYDEALVEANVMSEKAKTDQDEKTARMCIASVLSAQRSYQTSISLVEDDVRREDLSGSSDPSVKKAMAISYPKGFEKYVNSYSEKFGVDSYLVYALIREESRFNPRGLSWAMAHGLTQIIPSTGRRIAKNMQIKPYYTSRLFEPSLNIKMGSYYLSQLLQMFEGNKYLALASYNGGAGNVKKWMRKTGTEDIDEFVENIPYRETRGYVKKVLESYWQYRRLYEGS